MKQAATDAIEAGYNQYPTGYRHSRVAQPRSSRTNDGSTVSNTTSGTEVLVTAGRGTEAIRGRF